MVVKGKVMLYLSLQSLLLLVLVPKLGPTIAQQITVEIQSHKTMVVLGEPVFISATVVNHGPEAVNLIHHNAPTVTQGQLSVIDLCLSGEGTESKRWGHGFGIVKKTSPKLLPPERSMTIDMIMLFNREDGFFATTPGKYWMAGRVVIDTNPYLEVFSDPFEIEVRAPSAMIDSRNWDWLSTNKGEYGRMVQVPWVAKLSDEFLREAGRRCEASQSIYNEYLGLFLSRCYREGPKKDAELASRFAQIALERATTDKIRSEAEKLLRNPRVEPTAPASAPVVAHAVDAETKRAVTESLEEFAAAFSGGRMDQCAALLSEDFLRNGALNKTRALEEFEEDVPKLHGGGRVSIRPEAFSGGPEADEVEVLGRLLAQLPGREIEEHKNRWLLRREGDTWLIRRWDRIHEPPGKD